MWPFRRREENTAEAVREAQRAREALKREREALHQLMAQALMERPVDE